MMISEHFKIERADRYAFIVTEIGLGKVIHSHKQQYNKWGTEPCVVEITSTGIAIVKTVNDKLITMYVLTLNEAEKYFTETAIPLLLAGIIRANMRKRFHLLQNEVKY